MLCLCGCCRVRRSLCFSTGNACDGGPLGYAGADQHAAVGHTKAADRYSGSSNGYPHVDGDTYADTYCSTDGNTKSHAD